MGNKNDKPDYKLKLCILSCCAFESSAFCCPRPLGIRYLSVHDNTVDEVDGNVKVLDERLFRDPPGRYHGMVEEGSTAQWLQSRGRRVIGKS